MTILLRKWEKSITEDCNDDVLFCYLGLIKKNIIPTFHQMCWQNTRPSYNSKQYHLF